MTMDLPMMDYEKEIQRALLCLQINRGYEIPSENEVLDARQHPVRPQPSSAAFVNLNAQLEEHEATLRREQELLQIADSDDNEETVDVDDDNEDDDNSGSESVHDYFSYSSGYPQNFMNIQTLPINLQGAKRLDRCSSNDSGLGTSSLSPSQTTKQTNSNSEEETLTTVEPKRRFPKLGISSLTTRPVNLASQTAIPTEINTSSASSSSSSAPSSDNDESLVEVKLRTSTPQHSPSKPLELSGTEGSYVPSDWPEDQPLPTVEDLLYPGIKHQSNSSPSRFTKNSKKILSGFKTRTSTGLLKLKSTVSDMMKTEREEAALQLQIFERITKTADDEDDFSIHMIKEASLQRLTESAQAQSKDSTTQMGVFPPSGGRLRDNGTAVARPSRRSNRESREKSTPSPRNRAKKTHRLDLKSLEEQKRHKRNRKMITEVRRRVHEAHKRVQVDDQTHKPSKVPAAYRSDRTKQPVYTRGGQVPQFRNGELDWNYLWFFSDSSSATTNSTTNSSNPGDLSQLTTNQTVITNEFCSFPSSASATSSTDSSIIEEKPRATVTPPPTAIGSPPSRNIKPSPQPVLRHATKKRIRKLTVNPPTEDSMTLLGMV